MNKVVTVRVDCESEADLALTVECLGRAITGLTLQTGTYASISLETIDDNAEVQT